MPSPRRLFALVGLSSLAAAVGFTPALAALSVHVDLKENSDGGMMIATSAESVGAGKVTFDVTNKSSDIEHEFLIARLRGAPEDVPIDEANGIVKEAALDGVRELGDLEPGNSGILTLDLKPGKYLLFCNLPGHFASGMYQVLTVTQ
jgi:uncharacterized cupredoxin-like copper-binding protein